MRIDIERFKELFNLVETRISIVTSLKKDYMNVKKASAHCFYCIILLFKRKKLTILNRQNNITHDIMYYYLLFQISN